MMMRWWRSFGLVIVVVMIGACGGDDEENGDGEIRPQNDEQPSPTLILTQEAPTEQTLTEEFAPSKRRQLEQQYETLRQAQAAINNVWTDLQQGQEVACSTEIPLTIAPGAITDEDIVSQNLRQAAVSIERSMNLWEAECQNPREVIPPEVINEGWLAAQSAADALGRAEDGLSG
jgi:hypothetical protein